MKAFLSGMPTCSLGLNTAGEDCTFHSVVSQKDWEAQKCVHFVPPDNGDKTEFEVMRYRISDNVDVPFRVVSNIMETGRTRVSVRFSGQSTCAADRVTEWPHAPFQRKACSVLAVDKCCTPLRTCQTARFGPPQKVASAVSLHCKCGRHQRCRFSLAALAGGLICQGPV